MTPDLDARITAELRYMDAAKIAEDFPGAQERKAIAAVMRWFSLHGVCAWKTDDSETRYTCAWLSSDDTNQLDNVDVIVVSHADLDELEKTLGIER